MFYAALLFPQKWYLFGVLDVMDFEKVEQKLETFIVVVGENCGKLGMFFSRREKKAVIFPDSPGESFVENLENLRFQQEPGKTYC